VQWAAFLSVFIDHDAAHNYAEKILCCFGCGWKGELWENFFKKGSDKDCIIVKTWDKFSFLSNNAYFSRFSGIGVAC